jgi:lysophospholipase L1-like esterase
LLLAACAPEPANRDSRGSEIIFLGDSLTAGVGASAGNDLPSRVSAALKVPIVNAGVPGDTTAYALARLDRDVLSRNPRLVVVTLGGNDFLQRRPLKETFRDLDEIVRRIQEKGAMVVVAGVRSGLFGSPAQAEYRALARRRRAALIPDLLDGVFGHPSLMSDGVHPNDAGYAVVAERVRRVVEPLLK